MTLEGEVGKLECIGGDEVRVSVINAKSKTAASWRGYSPTLTFDVTQHGGRAYPIGRKVKITVEPK